MNNGPMNEKEKFEAPVPKMHPEFLLIWWNTVAQTTCGLMEKISKFMLHDTQPEWGESQIEWLPKENCRICMNTGWAEYEGQLINPQVMAKTVMGEDYE